MNLEALLQELRVNLLRDDAELASGPDDRLWSDETLVAYINDAQSRLARRALVLRDSTTPEVVEVALAATVAQYTLHPSILAVVSARLSDTDYDLARSGRSRLSFPYEVDQPYWPSSVALTTPGRPTTYFTDEALDIDTEGAVRLTVYPTPSATEEGLILRLRTARLPLELFTVSKLNAVCELPEDYQLDMLEWAAYRALRTSDIDGHSTRAEEHERRFLAAIDEVQRDIRRKMRTPVTFSMGAGFAWEQ